MINIEDLKNKKLIGVLVLLALFCWYGVFLCRQIDLTTADLGRHLKNGELILKNFSFDNPILKTNFYSYTEPDYSVINHHWLSGVVFFLVFKAVDFVGLHLFFIVLSFLAFWLFYRLAQKQIGIGLAAILSLLAIPLISERVEIRPEVFSYVLAGLFLNLLWENRENRLGWKSLLWLPLLEIFWVNSHVYFFLGPVLIGVFLADFLFSKARRKFFWKTSLIFALTCLATLINPFGFQGSLTPLNIFNNYGYRLVENQSVWFLEKLGFINNPNFLLVKICLGILLLSFIGAIKANWRQISLTNVFMALGFGAAAVLALRNFTIFGLFFLPITAANLRIYAEKLKLPPKIELDFFSLPNKSLLAVSGIAIVIFLSITHQSRLLTRPLGLSLLKGNQGPAEFFISHNLAGPVFNNYDIGGYLIYYLFPKEKVFVDNRPEAYSVDFFQKQYIPVQESREKWQEIQAKYGFNAVFFAWHDATPWGQQFLVQLIKDLDWAPVYVDNFAIIFLKRVEKNQDIISQHEIPQSYFKTNL